MKNKTNEVIEPWAAFVAPTERVALEDSAGRIAASTIRQYPPGIPEIIPGTAYSPQVLNSLEAAHIAGINIIGVDMEADRYIDVIAKTKNLTKNQLNIETHDAHEISDSVANEIADFFRIGFCEDPYFHFAFHESDPLQSLPHTLDFEAYTVSTALSDPEKRQACQDSLRGIAYERAFKNETPFNIDAVILPKGFHLWTDKSLCRQRIKERMTDPGYVTLVRRSEHGKLLGLLHSRMGTVERLFKSEEWSDPLLFSQYCDDSLRTNPEVFYKKIEYHFNLKPQDAVMTTSAQVLHPDLKGGEVFYNMMKSMASKIKPEHAALPILSEIPQHGTAHALNTALNERIVFGILKNGHPVVYSSQMSQSLFLLISDKFHWNHAIRKAVREKREYRTQYFISQPTDHDAVDVKPNGDLGLAVFATENIPAGTRIAVFTGEKYQAETALGLPEIMRNHAIQTGPQEFVFGYKGLAHCLCHSCDPNCGIRTRTEIFTIRDITAGEQLTWDYRCSENSNWVLETCLCGTERCTGSVANFDSLPSDIKTEYLSKSMVSDWIRSTAFKQD